MSPRSRKCAEPLLNTSPAIQYRPTAVAPRALPLLRRTARLLVGFAAVCGVSGAVCAISADDAMARSERLQRWSTLAEPSAARLQSLPPMLPVEGVSPDDLRDSFDAPRSHGRHHLAIDIMAPRNTPVVAAVDGEIRKLTTSAGGGLTIYQFDESESRVYYYAHLQRYREGLRERTIVRRGEIIGYVGTSGDATPDAPHLHFAIAELPPSKAYWKGVPVDPYPLLARSPSLDTDSGTPATGNQTASVAARR
jgi:murein DD-endopeptidase MepM/ murein hydrolase activator NlpD